MRFHWSPSNISSLRCDGIPASPGRDWLEPVSIRGIGICLVGAADQDTDEYDRHVIAHESGHYLEYYFSRSDSIGGPHALPDQLDLRVAFGEAGVRVRGDGDRRFHL